jgi:EAL domain-containing protein (putative c-di-GMP-specific phosphodiesterase class I)/CheY-like chemotaxis protein
MSARDTFSQIGSVLIVDDSRVQRDHVAAICRELGIANSSQAGNGREALALLAGLESLPDLMIIDLEMPTMDGVQLLEQLKQQKICVPVIVASSRERPLIDSVLAMGHIMGLQVLDALQKPLRLDTIRAALQKWNAADVRGNQAVLPIDAEALRAALDADQIKVYYQPKVDTRTGVVRGVEALARWQHPTLGWVPPNQFIPLAENNDLIHALTLHVMNQAMLQLADWQARGLQLSLALNLSPLLLQHPDIAQEISSLQQSYELSAEQIILEVTESSVVSRLEVALGVLARLRLRGFGLSIDDYGTGFSTLQQLARIPFTELKIDRSFVHGAHQRENLRVILRSALDMANKLGLTTVAEGLEMMEDWKLLRECGCSLVQGFLIAKPMPGSDFCDWLKTYSGDEDGGHAAGG